MINGFYQFESNEQVNEAFKLLLPGQYLPFNFQGANRAAYFDGRQVILQQEYIKKKVIPKSIIKRFIKILLKFVI